MSEFLEDPPAVRRRTVAEIRADFDDEFGRRPTPFDVARRRLMGPAIAHMAIGFLGVVGMIALAVIGVVAYVEDEWDVIELALGESGFFLGGCLFVVVALGGVSMLRLRHRWLALVAAYVVTLFSLASCYGILFYPFGIWALVVLYRPDARRQFGKNRPVVQAPITPPADGELPATMPVGAPKPLRPAHDRLLPSAVAFLAIGVLGFLSMVVTCCWVWWDSEMDSWHWSESEVIWGVGLSVVGAAAFALMAIGGYCLLRVRNYGLARLAAYLVASVPLIGLPLGVRALILLHQSEIRHEFLHPRKAGKDGHG